MDNITIPKELEQLINVFRNDFSEIDEKHHRIEFQRISGL